MHTLVSPVFASEAGDLQRLHVNAAPLKLSEGCRWGIHHVVMKLKREMTAQHTCSRHMPNTERDLLPSTSPSLRFLTTTPHITTFINFNEALALLHFFYFLGALAQAPPASWECSQLPDRIFLVAPIDSPTRLHPI